MTDAELFRSALEYFPETGRFVWKVSPTNCVTAGSVAGSHDSKGYWRIKYRGRAYRAHRIAWLLMTGEWPLAEIDHRNLDKLDNRWCNLRVATHAQNLANSIGRGKFPKGVSLHQGGKFMAQISNGTGKSRYLGLFKTADEAAAAYATAAKEHFGEFARAE